MTGGSRGRAGGKGSVLGWVEHIQAWGPCCGRVPGCHLSEALDGRGN